MHPTNGNFPVARACAYARCESEAVALVLQMRGAHEGASSMGGVLAAIVVGTLLPGCDTTIVAIGIPTLMESFGAGTVAVQWVSTGYLLALAIGIPVAGWLERRRGGGRLPGRVPRGGALRRARCRDRAHDAAQAGEGCVVSLGLQPSNEREVPSARPSR